MREAVLVCACVALDKLANSPSKRASTLNNESPIIIVSGLPRSGTSLLMQMLHAGGVQPMNDEKRPPDFHNPKGYLECERVKRLAADCTWLSEAKGMALKIIVPLIPFLPTGNTYQILFIDRDVNEIVQSQESMLNSLGSRDLIARDRVPLMESMLTKAIEFAKQHPDTRFKLIQHRNLISQPAESARQIAIFLGKTDLDLGAMSAAVDPSLYRNRIAKSNGG